MQKKIKWKKNYFFSNHIEQWNIKIKYLISSISISIINNISWKSKKIDNHSNVYLCKTGFYTHSPSPDLTMYVVYFYMWSTYIRQQYTIPNLSHSLFSHRAVMRIRVMIIWWWMRLVGGRWPQLALPHSFHLHTSCKHSRSIWIITILSCPPPPLPATHSPAYTWLQ